MLTTPLSRRAFGAGAVLAAASVATAGCTGEQDQDQQGSGELRTVRVNTGLGLFQGREAYLTIADQRGFFAEEGIRVDIVGGEGTETNLTQLATGEVQVATIDVNAGMAGFASGTFTDFVLTAVLHPQLLGCIMVLADSRISRPRDLEGTRIAVIPGGTNTILFPAFAQLTGFDPDTVEFVSPSPQSFGTLLGTGDVEAIQQFVVARGSIEHDAGRAVTVFAYSDALPELYGSALGCSRQLLAEDPELVRAFNRAALRGLRYATDNPAEAGDIFAGHRRHEGGQPAPVAAVENELLAQHVYADDGFEFGEFDPVRLAQSAGILRSYGVIQTSIRPEEIVAFDMFG